MKPQPKSPIQKPRSWTQRLTISLVKFVFILLTSFLIFFWLTNSSFKEHEFLSQTSRVTVNFLKIWEEKIPASLRNLLSPDLKPTKEEDLLDYKLTMVSKSIDQYFKNLLLETQDQVASKSLLAFMQDNRNYYNYYKIKRDLQKYLEENRDVLEFSLYDLTGKRIVSLKHKDVPEYFISDDLFAKVGDKNNLLLKHKNSSNLVLFSSVTHQSKQVMVISQTIHPVFFTRILNYLEASKELFYLKDSDDFIIVDNYDARNVHQDQAKIIEGDSETSRSFISLYQTFVNLHEKNIKIDMDSIEYSLGMVVERNNIWGNVFSIFTLILIMLCSKVALDSLLALIHFVFNLKVLKNVLRRQSPSPRSTPAHETLSPASSLSTKQPPSKKNTRFRPPWARKTVGGSREEIRNELTIHPPTSSAPAPSSPAPQANVPPQPQGKRISPPFV